ncbi:MAG: adenosylcobalamin-dependent ribonucleoside-diphosphate reductase [Fervidicoccaceae archaeon]
MASGQVEIRVKNVIKRDGRVEAFDANRIRNAIKKAMLSVGKYDPALLEKIVEYVLKTLDEKFGDKAPPHVEEIQDIVELALVKFDQYEVAKAYILYRKEREKIREEKKKLLEKDYVDEVDKSLSLNAVRLLASRYLLRDERGKLVEDPKRMFIRVAALVVIPDILYDPRIFDVTGSQPRHPREEFDAAAWEGKVGLKGGSGGVAFAWNRYHLERMKALYDRLNSEGKMRVSWSEFWSMLLSGAFDRYYENFKAYYDLMAQKKFLPNSPTLFNAGARLGQLSACFVLGIEDNIESIMEAAMEAAIIFKSGGGVGINYSKLRPEGDIVTSTAGVASGPVSFMRIIDTVTDVIKQGGKRRGANMGILEIWHPDVEKFITCKASGEHFQNFNISVMITEDFWRYYERGEPYPLVNPRDGRVWKTIDPRSLLHMIAENAWRTGDPGVLFLDNINRRNVLLKVKGPIRATNPCGEQPLYPYGSCNLGSINVHAFVRREESGSARFDWDAFRETVRLTTRFLDNVIDVNLFPLPQVEAETLSTRKIGLGIMGLADALYALGIPYNSEAGFEFMRVLAENLSYYSMLESVKLAEERGAFPLFAKSAYVDGEMPFEGYYRRELWTLDWSRLVEEIKRRGIRNVETTTIAPTGSISMIFDVSSGIEPQFALVYEKRVTLGTFYYVDVEFERALKERGLYSEELLKKVAENGGSVQGLDGVPEDIKRVFVVAYDIPWWDHLRAQYEMQLWISSSISKTINMPHWVTVDDVLKAFLFAHRLGLKGVTVFREGSKGEQVLVTPSQRRGYYVAVVENSTLDLMRRLGIEPPLYKPPSSEGGERGKPRLRVSLEDVKRVKPGRGGVEECPECGGRNLVHSEKCVTCADCGWSGCPVS